LAVHVPGRADFNLFAYVTGRALRATDPLGLECGVNESCDYSPNAVQTAPPAAGFSQGPTYSSAPAPTETPKASTAPNQGGQAGAPGKGVPSGTGGTFGETPTPRNASGGYSIEVNPLEMVIQRDAPKNASETTELAGRLVLEGETYVLAGAYRVPAMLIGAGLMSSAESPGEFMQGGMIFGAGWLGSGTTASPTKPALDLRFSQTTASATFHPEGTFAGKTIGQMSSELRAGTVSTSEVPVGYVTTRQGTNLIVNTRSSLALRRAGVQQADWNLVDKTATELPKIEERLIRNKLTSEGTRTLRITGLGKDVEASNLE